MPPNRLFLPHQAVDFWLDTGKARLVGNLLTLLPTGHTLQLAPALRFKAEVTDGADPYDLVGKVKSIAAVGELEGEHYADSVIMGDNAYEVEEGFLAEIGPESNLVDDGHTPDPLARIIMEL